MKREPPRIAYWNYRLVQYRDDDGTPSGLGLHEAYYDASNQIQAYTEDAVEIVFDDLGTVDDTLASIRLATERPILEHTDLLVMFPQADEALDS